MPPASLASSVAGVEMSRYVRQVLKSKAYAASGTPGPSASVTQIPGGFQLCWPGVACQAVTGFRSNASGRITDFLVNDQPVSSRFAIGADGAASGLAISSVSAYLSNLSGITGVIFSVRNVSDGMIGDASPAFLPVFVTPDGTLFNCDLTKSILPGPLQPGESDPAIAIFDTSATTGRFSLRANTQLEQVLVSTTLHRP